MVCISASPCETHLKKLATHIHANKVSLSTVCQIQTIDCITAFLCNTWEYENANAYRYPLCRAEQVEHLAHLYRYDIVNHWERTACFCSPESSRTLSYQSPPVVINHANPINQSIWITMYSANSWNRNLIMLILYQFKKGLSRKKIPRKKINVKVIEFVQIKGGVL